MIKLGFKLFEILSDCATKLKGCAVNVYIFITQYYNYRAVSQSNKIHSKPQKSFITFHYINLLHIL